jgi:signal transduction histidine kinase
MSTTAVFAKLERTVRLLAVTLGAAVAIGAPLGFGVVAYRDHVDMAEFRAALAAERLGKFAYVQGATWRYSGHRIHELIGTLDTPGETLQTVVDATGRDVAAIGNKPHGPSLRVAAPIIAGDKVLGAVYVDWDMATFRQQLSVVAMLGLLLGLSVYGGVHVLPLRALREAVSRLGSTEDELRAQVSKTEMALEAMRREWARAEEASNAKSKFLANMSHELRTPLNAIIGFSEVMNREMFGPVLPRYRGYTEDIHRSGTHLLGIVNDVLDMAKVASGQVDLAREAVEPAAVIDECVRLTSERALSAGIRVHVECDGATLSTAFLDHTKLRQILLNLLSNAIKFTPRGGHVTVEARATAPGWLMFAVTDTGIGMTPKEARSALQPFHQVAHSYARDQQGTGLGLPIAAELTKLHGGTLRLASEPRRGTRVTVLVPTDGGGDDGGLSGDQGDDCFLAA